MGNNISELQYLGMSGWQKFCYNFASFFRRLPRTILSIFTVLIPRMFKKIVGVFKGIYKTIVTAASHGDWKTRMSFGVMGFSYLARKRYARGLFYLFFEIAFIAYMALFGGYQLSLLGTLGTIERGEVQLPDGTWGYTDGQDSRLILIYSILSLIFIVSFVYAWYKNVKASYYCQLLEETKQHIPDVHDDLRDFADGRYHITLLAGPLVGICIFTVLPILFMVFLAFTNFDSSHLAPQKLFTWVGFENFRALFSGGLGSSGSFGGLFGKILIWTVVWAIFATFSNYILGMIVALIINKKGIRFKKLWRTILIMTVAVPQFVSLLLMSQMLSDNGYINSLLGTTIPWLSDPWVAKVTVIIVNIWIGIPFTMLMVTGILMNIPADLYESAKIDGAGPVKMYFKITLPYVLHVTTPQLISSFIGNLNNFGVIYLLTGGGPAMTIQGANGAGDTDLLITWLYKLVMDRQEYGKSSVISIVMFLITAVISLITYNRSKAVKNEEDFM